MTPQIGRGFLALMLQTDQIHKAVAFESQFPRGRYLMPFEIALHLKLKIDKVLIDIQIESMRQTWVDFCREKNLDQETTLGDHDVARDWMFYAVSRYQEPLPAPQRNWEAS